MGELGGVVFVGYIKFILADHRPVRSTTVMKDDGKLTCGPGEVLDCWYLHFKKSLNVMRR